LARTEEVAIHVAHQALQRIEEEGWARRRDGGYILQVAADAPEVAESQLRYEPPVVVTVISPKRIRGVDANLLDELSEGIHTVFPVCSIRTLYIDTDCWLAHVRQLLQQEASALRETGFLLRSVSPEVQQFFESSHVPCVVLGDPAPTLKLPCLYQDMTQAGFMAARILLPHGRTLVLCHEDLVGGEVRLLQGFARAAVELGLPPPSPANLYFHLPDRPDEYLRVIERLLTSRDRPAGVLAIRPEFALATVKLAARHRISIPHELQVIGYPTHPMYRFAHPELTSVGVSSIQELGKQSALLLARCMGRLPEEPCRIQLATQVFQGESTLPAPPP
jgi:DNA-binding LacI/PurR family transcriptional regulator